MDAKEEIRQERSQIFRDVFDNKIPKRVPIDVKLALTFIADYGNIDRKSAYWEPLLLRDTIKKLCKLIPSDSCIYEGTVYTPSESQTLGSLNRVMSEKGYMQHPNTHCMFEDEYDELIADPYAFLIEKCLPRIYKNLDSKINAGPAVFSLAQAAYMEQSYYGKVGEMLGEIYEKCGYSTDVGKQGFGRAPMDWIGDQLRSFTGICMDVRRQRSKLIEALEAIYPMMYKIGVCDDLSNVDRYSPTTYQLHMASFLREKDFAEVWFPQWKRLLTDYASLGMRCGAFLEHDWGKILDYLQELPTGTYFTFELTDPKQIKEKLGKKFILGGGFPIKYLKSCTKNEVIKKTKEWLDIMAPGGQYIFGLDKSPVSLDDINLENLIAVCETVMEYGVYENTGDPAGQVFEQKDYKHSLATPFTSKYYLNWAEYLERFPNTPENAKYFVMSAQDNTFIQIFYLSC